MKQQTEFNSPGDKDVPGVIKANNIPPADAEIQDAAEAIKLLARVCGGSDGSTVTVTFQTFDDNNNRKDASLAKVYHGTLDQYWDILQQLNDRGAGIFFTVNKTDLKGRRKGNITGIRALWQEDDGEGKPLPISPHIVTKSSPGHYHRYFITSTEKVDEFEAVQQRMVDDYGSDPAAKDRARVLRLPGFFHQKVDSRKGLTGVRHLVRVVEQNDEPVLTWGEAKNLFPPVERKQPAKEYQSNAPGTVVITPEQEKDLQSALDFMPADDRILWVAIGQSLVELGAVGFRLWDTWSMKSEAYDADDQESRWAGFTGDNTGYASVFNHAQEMGWENPARIDIDDFMRGSHSTEGAGEPLDSFDWAKEFTLTNAEADEIANPAWIYKNLIIQGHVIVIPAPPNGGKTTIMFHIACELAEEGHEVIYVNADISGGDAKPMVKQAHTAGVTLLLPDMKGRSMDEVLKNLVRMDQSGQRFDGKLAIFDTLKKMVDVISKNKAKQLYILFRSLSAKGMTIVLLAHTNKYNDENGKLIYEGTADLRSDVDEMIFFEPTKHDDKSMTVTTMPDKVRGAFDPITFHIDPFRNVSLADDVVDTHAINELHKKIHQDRPVIDLVDEAIDAGKVTGKDIKSYAKEHGGISWRLVERVLKTYSYDMAHGLGTEPDPRRSPGLYWIARRGVAKSFRYMKAQY